MKGAIALVFFVCGLIGLFYYSMHSKKKNWNDLTTKGLQTVGTVAVKFKGIDISYSVNGRTYDKSIRSKPRGIISGEKFILFYDQGEPQNSVVDFHAPVFDSLQFTRICVESFEKIGSSSDGLVKFEYVHEGEEITRFHKAKKGLTPSNGPHEVWVNNTNPRISYLTGQPCLD